MDNVTVGRVMLAVCAVLIYGSLVFVAGWLPGTLIALVAVVFAGVIDFAVGLAVGLSPREVWRDFP